MKRSFVIIFTIVLCLSVSQTKAGWTITQLTDNHVDDGYPVISGTNVVWTSEPLNPIADGDVELYSNFAGRLTYNDYDERTPAISGTNVVWAMDDGTDWEIYSNFAGALTNNTTDDYRPAISGTNVVWDARIAPYTSSDFRIFSNFAGQLTSEYSRDSAISGTNVVWYGGSPLNTIPNNFGAEITTPTTYSEFPDISGTNVVWRYHDGSDWEIYSNFAGQLSDNDFEDFYPAISGTNVVWTGFDGTSEYIFSNFAEPLDVSNTGTGGGHYVDISGTTVVWSGADNSDYETYGRDHEIFMATWTPDEPPGPPAAIPAPGALLLGGIGAGVVSWLRRRRTL